MPDCRSLRAIAFASFAVLCSGIAQGAQAKLFAQWVQLGPDGASSVRAITDEACPQVIFDGTPAQMSVRSEPSQKIDNVKPASFLVRSCETGVTTRTGCYGSSDSHRQPRTSPPDARR